MTIQNDDLSEIKVEEPESPAGFTYANYLTWNFEERVELIRGKIFKMSPAPTVSHQKIQTNIFGAFFIFLKIKNVKFLCHPSM